MQKLPIWVRPSPLIDLQEAAYHLKNDANVAQYDAQGNDFDTPHLLTKTHRQPPPSARYKFTIACNCCNLSPTPFSWAASSACSEVSTSV